MLYLFRAGENQHENPPSFVSPSLSRGVRWIKRQSLLPYPTSREVHIYDVIFRNTLPMTSAQLRRSQRTPLHGGKTWSLSLHRSWQRKQHSQALLATLEERTARKADLLLLRGQATIASLRRASCLFGALLEGPP